MQITGDTSESTNVTASRTGTIHAFTTVAYDGAIRIQAVYYFFYGWARAGAWVRQMIRIYDTSNWALVTSNTYCVYSQTVQSGATGWVNWNERVFDGTRDKYGISVDFTQQSVTPTPLKPSRRHNARPTAPALQCQVPSTTSR